jgi:hypothetical protein
LLLMMVVLRMAVRGETSERGRPTSKPAAAQISRPRPGARQAGKSEGGSKAKALPGVGVGRLVGSQREVTRREGTVLPILPALSRHQHSKGACGVSVRGVVDTVFLCTAPCPSPSASSPPPPPPPPPVHRLRSRRHRRRTRSSLPSLCSTSSAPHLLTSCLRPQTSLLVPASATTRCPQSTPPRHHL